MLREGKGCDQTGCWCGCGRPPSRSPVPLLSWTRRGSPGERLQEKMGTGRSASESHRLTPWGEIGLTGCKSRMEQDNEK